MTRWFAMLVRRRLLVLVLALDGAAGGIANLQGLSIDAVPDISPKQVMILTRSPGLGPLEVERLITFPVENAMAGAPGMAGIRSVSRAGISAVYVTFHDAIPIREARDQVFQRLPLAKSMMPAGVGDPQMGPMATGLGEIYQFELRGPATSPMELKRILQWTIAPKLKLTPGVANKESVAIGDKLYRAGDAARGIPACASCHGPVGAGQPSVGYPRIGGQNAEYALAALQRLHGTATESLPEGNVKMMATIASKLSDKEMAALASYLNGLQ